MDLKQQLIIWKRSSYLLDNIAMTRELVSGLVDNDLFNVPMMDDVQSHDFQVERTLKMLSLLGTRGENVYNKFLSILDETGHRKAANELRRVYRKTHFGEMLPPIFTYFLSISEFLRKYPHIANKLGEDEKHIVQTFIEGKLDIEYRKVQEGLKVAHNDNEQLLKVIENHKQEILELQQQERALQVSLKQANETISKLKHRVMEIENTCIECRSEVRRLKHFRMELEDTTLFISQKGKEYGIKKQENLIQRMPTQSNFTTGKALVLRLRLLLSQVNLMVNKLYYTQKEMEHLENEEKKLVVTIKMNTMDYETHKEAKKVLAETRKEKKLIAQQISEGENEMFRKEKEIQAIRTELFGIAATPDFGYGGEPDSLKNRMCLLLCGVRDKYKAEMRGIHDRYGQEIAGIRQQMRDMEKRFQQEFVKQKIKHRQKMMEVHKVEMLHKRMRNQINALTRYHAKNMNATQSVEQCRKVVREIIGDARKLKRIADEKDRKEEDLTEEEKEKLRLEEEKREKKKQIRKRKKWTALANERLMYVADRIGLQWRDLGKAMGITNNRMDMVEFEVVGRKPDQIAFMMLKTWRDEDGGKAEQLVLALKEMNRPDLALMVTPIHRIEVVKNEEYDEDTYDEMDDEDFEEKEESLVEMDDELKEDDDVEEDVQSVTAKPKKRKSNKGQKRRRKLGSRSSPSNNKSSPSNNKAAVPKLPRIA
ncbi:hypothetical protein CAPTEDRAFT_222838 [Capitella teleta]|uniref:Death domain-containing protein n=1 Tax=Capitella teleta TaxID=283909 RepID=R7T6R1_CAPTE|nr:hypothetical protein CAPTEDRAFT_222838 [Capitella teleta]|eukprot:ELT87060.1 hypothetical protein CAPTEDRAFT_222838 [Capitella teleta]